MKISIGFLGLLAIVFIVLKLTGTISWQWIWVVSPIWLYAIAYLSFWVGYTTAVQHVVKGIMK